MPSELPHPHRNLGAYLIAPKGNTMPTAPRAGFALPGGRFPLNTPGRVKAAPGLAAYSEKKGNITPAQEAAVDRKAAAHSGTPGSRMRSRLNGMTLGHALSMKEKK